MTGQGIFTPLSKRKTLPLEQVVRPRAKWTIWLRLWGRCSIGGRGAAIEFNLILLLNFLIEFQFYGHRVFPMKYSSFFFHLLWYIMYPACVSCLSFYKQSTWQVAADQALLLLRQRRFCCHARQRPKFPWHTARTRSVKVEVILHWQ